MVAMEDAIEALMELVRPLHSRTMTNPVATPPISQQEQVAKQMHAIVLLFNYYHRKQCPQLDFLPFESFCKSAVIANQPLLGYLTKTASLSEDLSLVEKSIMQACNISMALFDNNARTIKTWPVEKVAVFLADAKREKCFLERDTLVKGVFSLLEREVDGEKAEDAHREIAFSEVVSRAGLSRTSLRGSHSRETYSLSKEKSRTVIFLVECLKPPPADKGFVEVPIKDMLNILKGPVFTGGSTPELTRVYRFFLLLPYAEIITDWLSKPTSELEKELEQRQEKSTTSNHKSTMQIKNPKQPSDGPSKAKGQNANETPVNKRKHATCVAAPSNNSSEIIKEINNVIQETDKASKEPEKVNSEPCTSTRNPIVQTSIKQESVPCMEKDVPSCLQLLIRQRDYMCEKLRDFEDELAECEMDLQRFRSEGTTASEVEEVVKKWKIQNSSKGQLDSSSGGSLISRKKKFKFRSSCQQLDDNCRDNKLALPRYTVHPSKSGGFYMARATLKCTDIDGMDIDCTADSDLKKTPREAREHAALQLMEKLGEMDDD